MRLNKFISHNTGYSRREADELIKNGKVSVNGRIISDFLIYSFFIFDMGNKYQ